jgi:hypothetical protein
VHNGKMAQETICVKRTMRSTLTTARRASSCCIWIFELANFITMMYGQDRDGEAFEGTIEKPLNVTNVLNSSGAPAKTAVGFTRIMYG